MDESLLRMVEKILYDNANEDIEEIKNKGKNISKDFGGFHKLLGVASFFKYMRGNIFVVGSKNLETGYKV